MTRDLETLREHEKRNAVLERDMALAHEVQEYLYPRSGRIWQVLVFGARRTPLAFSAATYMIFFLSRMKGSAYFVPM